MGLQNKAVGTYTKIYKIRSDGKDISKVSEPYWPPDDSTIYYPNARIVPFTLNDRPHILIHSHSGFTTISRIISNGQDIDNLWKGRWNTTWSHIVPFTLNGKAHIFSYKGEAWSTGTGDWAIDRIDPSQPKGVVEINNSWKTEDRWSDAYHHIVPFLLKNEPHILMLALDN